ncbi:MAG: cytochrome c-type biogenesis protein CcmH [Deltaproteobacteria bacterium]|nr:cytochrome c-type biogenesis protein CcmH [Deltaproteobacteria bacterium]
MKSFWKLIMMVVFGLVVACAKPSTDPNERIKSLGSQIRCPVCRGVPVSESPSTLANEMMDVIRQQVAAGKSDEEITKYFEERYGEWILLKPKAQGMNLTIWVLPVLVLLGGGAVIVIQLRRRRENSI